MTDLNPDQNKGKTKQGSGSEGTGFINKNKFSLGVVFVAVSLLVLAAIAF